MDSYYKIIKDKIYFSDQRMDQYYPEILSVFRKFDIIQTFYTSPTLEEFANENFEENLKKKVGIFNNIDKKVNDCLHKVIAARYSLALINQELSNKPTALDMKNHSQMIANKMCSQAEIKNDVLIYEVESFLFQSRSCLDILIQLLKYIPGYEYLDYSGDKCKESLDFNRQNIKNDTTYKMRENKDVKMADFFDKEINEWINELNETRNDITHRSGLIGFSCFVFESNSEKIIDPLMPNGEKVHDYCHNVFEKILDLYDNIFEKFILPKFNNK